MASSAPIDPSEALRAIGLDLIAEQLPAIIYTADRDLRFTSSIGAALRNIGLACNEVVGSSITAFLQGGKTPAEALVIDAHHRALAGSTAEYEHTWAGRRFRVRLNPLRDAGQITGIIGVAHDITEQHRAEQALRDEARQQLRLIREAIEHVHDMVVITDTLIDPPGPRIVYANPAFLDVTGFSASEVLGKTPRILQGPATSRKVTRAVRAALEAGRDFEGETTNYRKDGTPYIVHWRIAPVRDTAGTIVNWVSIQRDVTEERRQQALARQREAELAHAARLSTIGEMASGLAHELNQPLAAIANYASGCQERLRQDRLPRADLETALQRITQQAERSGEVIRRMRRFIRKREPQQEQTTIPALVHEAAALVEGELRRYQASLNIELSDDLPVLWIDSIQIEQVLLNLMRNALEAMEHAPAEDRVLTVRATGNGQTARIEVIDRGPALSDEQIQRMLTPFFTTKPTGMGMGLNISETLIHAHGGQLTARSVEPHGLCVTIELPARPTGTAHQ